MSEVVYRSEVRIERIKVRFAEPIFRLRQSRSSSACTAPSQRTTRSHQRSRSRTPPRSITSLQPPPVDSPEPLEARWRRVKLTHRTNG
jgi:hypothetical protein